MIEVLAAGPLLTVQDLGRPGARRYGVPLGGAMDPFALAAANKLVGNPPNAAGLELTAGGVELRFARPTLLALAGADLGATLEGQPAPLWTALAASAGWRLRLAGRPADWGARAYLALAGGVAVRAVLGSRATELAGGFGGLAGRALRRGDWLPCGRPEGSALALGQHWPQVLRPHYQARPTLRLLPGPHLAWLQADALAALEAAKLRVGAAANRMGYRLEGVRLGYAQPGSLPSLGVVPGAIQLPPDGAPILLMADAQTTGGYPVLGVVIEADLPLAAQLLPGDELRLMVTTLDQALAARQALREAASYRPAPDEGYLLASLAGA